MMEEEYRMQKAQVDVPRHSPPLSSPGSSNNIGGGNGELVTVIHEDGSVSRSPVGSVPKRGESLNTAGGGADDNASTRGVRSEVNTPAPSHSGKDSMSVPGANGLPTIRISTESNRERTKATEQQEQENGGEEDQEEEKEAGNEDKGKGNGVKVDPLEKPSQIGVQDGGDVSNPSQEAFSFSNKRLCERWLDNLFMVLYEVSFPLILPCVHFFNSHAMFCDRI